MKQGYANILFNYEHLKAAATSENNFSLDIGRLITSLHMFYGCTVSLAHLLSVYTIFGARKIKKMMKISLFIHDHLKNSLLFEVII